MIICLYTVSYYDKLHLCRVALIINLQNTNVMLYSNGHSQCSLVICEETHTVIVQRDLIIHWHHITQGFLLKRLQIYKHLRCSVNISLLYKVIVTLDNDTGYNAYSYQCIVWYAFRNILDLFSINCIVIIWRSLDMSAKVTQKHLNQLKQDLFLKKISAFQKSICLKLFWI